MTARLLRPQNFRWKYFHLVAFVLCAWFSWLVQPALGQNVRLFEDNADSIAVVIGNKSYRQTVSVEFAHNDADAMRDFLSRSLGFRDSNIFVLKDATLSEFSQMLGSERSPQSGRLWRTVKEGRSNVFVYFSGHGVPDLQTRQPFLLPSDGNPNQAESGFQLDLLYRNLEQVKRKVGPDRQVIVMIDACFTGETGRRGESLLSISAPGFVPARPKTGSGVVKLLATSAASPANWDQEDKLGLFTSRFLLGVAGLTRVSDAETDLKPDFSWAELRRFVIDSVTEGARRETGREQVPEIDEAALTLKSSGPVPAIERGYGRMRDEAGWLAAEAANTVAALENYIANCGTVCAFKDRALDALIARRAAAARDADAANWQKLSALEKYQEYVDGCGRVCAYRDIAKRYLADAAPGAPTPPSAAAAPVAPPVAMSGSGGPCGTKPTAVSLSSRPGRPLSAGEECGLKPRDVFKECDNCPEMVVVPSGSFTMGSPADEKERGINEGPQHVVTIGTPFAVGRLHVTVDQFAAFVAETKSDAGSKCFTVKGSEQWWRNPGFVQDGSHPVVCLSWNDAKAYVDWLTKRTGKPYRLLTESEWEYAARGRTSPGSYPRFWFGNDEKHLCRYGNGADQKARDRMATWLQVIVPCDDGYAYTSPAGRFAENNFGLRDMFGNAWQWTADCWHNSYDGAPTDGSAWTSGDCSSHVLRGGAWAEGSGGLRAAVRGQGGPGLRENFDGFRVGRTLIAP
jgi:formylglycine-generating enzyme required for sulfatase activity